MQGKAGKILVVEDEAVTAMNVVDLLEFWGYGVCEPAASGEEAIQRAEEEKPELVLMDINIQGKMDGIEAAMRIRKDFGVPVLFITGYADSEVRNMADAVRPVGYLFKPFDPEELKSLVKKALQ